MNDTRARRIIRRLSINLGSEPAIKSCHLLLARSSPRKPAFSLHGQLRWVFGHQLTRPVVIRSVPSTRLSTLATRRRAGKKRKRTVVTKTKIQASPIICSPSPQNALCLSRAPHTHHLTTFPPLSPYKQALHLSLLPLSFPSFDANMAVRPSLLASSTRWRKLSPHLFY